MKLSELIKELQSINQKYGNMDVILADTYQEQFCLLKEHEVRVEGGLVAIIDDDEGGEIHYGINDNVLVIGIL